MATDGVLELNAVATTINSYAHITSDVNSGETSISVSNSTPFTAGSEILIIQMQGESNAGNYEFNKLLVLMVVFWLLKIQLQRTYSSSDGAQVVHVPNYESVYVASDSTIRADEWDGQKGESLAFRSTGTTNIEGTINVNAQGYRGEIQLRTQYTGMATQENQSFHPIKEETTPTTTEVVVVPIVLVRARWCW